MNIKQSMNSQVDRVTLSQYQQIKLTLAVMEFLEANSFMKISEEFCEKVKELKQLSSKKIIKKIQKLLKISKWNNILHVKIVQLTKKYLHMFYKEFFEEIQEARDISSGFLGVLVEMFRNSVFMFLESGKRASYGDRHVIYTLSKIITNQFVVHGDIKSIYQKFPLWKQFVNSDLSRYHDQHFFQLCSDHETVPPPNLWRHKSLELS